MRLILFVMVLLLAAVSFSANISSCQLINTPGTHQLVNDVEGAPNTIWGSDGACIVIQSSNVEFSCNGYSVTNNGTADMTVGVIALGSYTNITIENCPNISDYTYGAGLDEVDNSTIRNVTAHGNRDAGIFIARSGDNNLVINNTAYNHLDESGYAEDGFYVHSGSNNSFINNIAYNNVIGFDVREDSVYTNLTNNIAYNNTDYGFFIDNSDYNILTNNTAYDAGVGFYMESPGGTPEYNDFINNMAYNNYFGIVIYMSLYTNLVNNTARNNTLDGIVVDNSYYNNLTNNTAYENGFDGIILSGSYHNNLIDNTAHDNGEYGLMLLGSENSSIFNTHLYNNLDQDFYIEAYSEDFSVFIYNMVIDNPSGTSLDIIDVVEVDTAYSINGTSNSTGLPTDMISFAQKFVDISPQAGTVVIDSITWTWTDSEAGGYYESLFELWEYAETWNLLNDTPDIWGNTLSLTDLNPASDYGILMSNTSQCVLISSPGAYELSNDVIGAPIDASEIPNIDWACIKIASSDVDFNCNAYDITNNGTLDAAAVVVNGSGSLNYTNITVRNCFISSYETGVYFYYADGSTIANVSSDSNSDDGVYLLNSASIIVNNSKMWNNYNGLTVENSNECIFIENLANNNTGSGFLLFENANWNEFMNNEVYDNSYGFAILSYNYNNTFDDNTVYNSAVNGFFISVSEDNTLLNNVVYNSSEGGLFAEYSDRLLLFNNTIYDTPEDYRSIVVDISDDISIINNTIYNSDGGAVYFNDLDNADITSNFLFDSYGGFEINICNECEIINNIVYNINGSAFYIGDGVLNSNFTNNTLHDNQYGFYSVESYGNTYQDNTVYNTYQYAFAFGLSDDATLINNTVFNTTLEAIYSESDNLMIYNDHYYNNHPDLLVRAPFNPSDILLSGVIFDNPLGNMENYTILYVEDTIEEGTEYSIEWVAQPAPLPSSYSSFEQKYVNISGTSTLDIVTWTWSDVEADAYNENNLRVLEYDGGWTDGWSYVSDQELDTDANTITVNELLLSSPFGLMQYRPPSDGGDDERDLPMLSVDWEQICQGDNVSIAVTDDGLAVEGAEVELYIYEPLYEPIAELQKTNEHGKVSFTGIPMAGIYRVYVEASGYSLTRYDFDYTMCPAPACVSNEDCEDNEICVDGECVPVECPCGRIKAHACEEYRCCEDEDCPPDEECVNHVCEIPYECTSDSDCEDTESCNIAEGEEGGICEEISGCGEVRGHTIIPYECGDEPECPVCPSGFICSEHVCIRGGLSGPEEGYVGDELSISATADGGICANCEVVIIYPSGRNVSGSTDEDGNLMLPLPSEGDYTLLLLKDGKLIASKTVGALIKPTGPEEVPPTGIFEDLPTLLSTLLILLLALALLVIYWRRRGTKRERRKR